MRGGRDEIAPDRLLAPKPARHLRERSRQVAYLVTAVVTWDLVRMAAQVEAVDRVAQPADPATERRCEDARDDQRNGKRDERGRPERALDLGGRGARFGERLAQREHVVLPFDRDADGNARLRLGVTADDPPDR